MRDWDNIKEELKRNAHLFTLIEKSEIEVKERKGNTFILILVKGEPEAMVQKHEMEFLTKYCDSYNLTFFITEEPFSIYIVEDHKR